MSRKTQKEKLMKGEAKNGASWKLDGDFKEEVTNCVKRHRWAKEDGEC